MDEVSHIEWMFRDESDQKSIYFERLMNSSETVINIDMEGGHTPFDDSIATQLAVSLPSTITSFTFSSVGSSVTQLGIQTIF